MGKASRRRANRPAAAYEPQEPAKPQPTRREDMTPEERNADARRRAFSLEAWEKLVLFVVFVVLTLRILGPAFPGYVLLGLDPQQEADGLLAYFGI